ncbi:hypothetical protein [Segeticoccus rhizosphaerae]|uniref:hypothetical protein n=1 Tax=Segeticoccus rhizosphaerae TaxID=1104777 RepID=UPI00126489E1|nr:hypothetical protein [Segeticoccus rhizosphaerae]
MPLLAPFAKTTTPPEDTMTPEQIADLQEVRDRAVKAQSVGATILSNMTQAIKGIDAILQQGSS